MGIYKKSPVARMIGRLSVVAGAAAVVAACGTETNESEEAVALGETALSCSSGTPIPSTPPNSVAVKIYFESGCPESVDQWAPVVNPSTSGPNNRVWWVAVNKNPADPNEVCQALDANYNIYFDPFAGNPSGSAHNGIVHLGPVQPGVDVPINVLYKYTIYTKNCPPLDPFIRIQ